jgi:hypothetical protein
MTRTILAAALSIVLSSAAFGQMPSFVTTPPTDDEIAAAVAACQKPENFNLIPPKNADGSVMKFAAAGLVSTKEYKPELAAPCKALEAEHAKRGLARKAQQADDLKRIGEISKRLNKKD